MHSRFIGKLNVKRHEPDILFISLQVDSLFKLATMMLLSIFIDSMSLTTSFKKLNVMLT